MKAVAHVGFVTLTASQDFARTERDAGADGIVYPRACL